MGKPLTAGEIEPLSDITTTDKDIKVVVEMPGIDKKDIKISAYDSSVEISTANTAQRKYRSVLSYHLKLILRQLNLPTIMGYLK